MGNKNISKNVKKALAAFLAVTSLGATVPTKAVLYNKEQHGTLQELCSKKLMDYKGVNWKANLENFISCYVNDPSNIGIIERKDDKTPVQNSQVYSIINDIDSDQIKFYRIAKNEEILVVYAKLKENFSAKEVKGLLEGYSMLLGSKKNFFYVFLDRNITEDDRDICNETQAIVITPSSIEDQKYFLLGTENKRLKKQNQELNDQLTSEKQKNGELSKQLKDKSTQLSENQQLNTESEIETEEIDCDSESTLRRKIKKQKRLRNTFGVLAAVEFIGLVGLAFKNELSKGAKFVHKKVSSLFKKNDISK